ncbi:MAG: sigma 54-interacting transcriptional regulator [Candidatus Tectomicrobia bacterium]|nr:sigma 54-interacting transcriptional regulator [Candidatus Tectomicrobia bacterium]
MTEALPEKKLSERVQIGRILLENNVLTQEQLEVGLRVQKERGGRIGEILLEQRLIKKEDLLHALSIQLEVPLPNTFPFTDQANRKVERLFMILKVCTIFNSEKNFESLLDLIVRETSTLLEADRATLFIFDEQKNELWSKIAMGLERGEIRFDARLGLAGHVLRSGEEIRIEDAYRDPRFNRQIDLFTRYKTQNVLGVPIRNTRGKILGVFEVLNKREGRFTDDDLEMLNLMAAQAGIALENVMLYEELTRANRSLSQENVKLKREVKRRFAFDNVIGTSKAIKNLLVMVEKVSDTWASVMITGESGTGKELIARTIHHNSSRAERRFVAVNCAALPESLLESELFGIEKGVATGVEERRGKFELASGGTLFLDEVGDMSLSTQAKVLRVIQERRFERIGGDRTIEVDIRILAATNKDLKAEIEKGKFREDLYYRLNVIPIHIPPLRERGEDIEILLRYFLDLTTQRLKKRIKGISMEAEKLLIAYPWPGNVRQLENEVERIVILADPNSMIEKEDLSEEIRKLASEEDPVTVESPKSGANSLRKVVEEIETHMIIDALKKTRGNKNKAARLLDLSREGLRKKMMRYGL